MWFLFYLKASCENFKDFDFSCAQNQVSKLKTLEIKIETLSSKKILVQDDKGYLHLFKVSDLINSQTTCALYFHHKSFKNNAFTSTSLRTDLNYGAWSSAQLEGLFSLKKSGKDCLLSIDRGLILEKDLEKKEENLWVIILSLTLLGLSVFLIARNLFQEEEQLQASQGLEESSSEGQSSFLLKLKPLLKQYLVPLLSQRKKQLQEDYKRSLAMAGLTKSLTPEEFFSLKLILILIFPLLFLIFRFLLEAQWNVFYALPVGLLGFYYPNIWIKGLIEKRQEDLNLQMPFVVDMLALSVEAGLDFSAAIARIIDKAPKGPLVEEFSIFLKEVQVGSSRADALRNLSWRVNTITIASFTSTLIAADSVGASIGGILKELSRELRQKRSTLIEKKGAQASTKMMFPMMLFILPAIFIIIAAPFVIQFFNT